MMEHQVDQDCFSVCWTLAAAHVSKTPVILGERSGQRLQSYRYRSDHHCCHGKREEEEVVASCDCWTMINVRFLLLCRGRCTL